MTHLPTRTLLTVVLAASLGCATVKTSHVTPDWKENDATQVKRLAVVVTPLPKDDPKLGDLWSTVARNYTNIKRDFIAKTAKSMPLPAGQAFDPKSQCGEGLEGVLWLAPTVVDQGDKVHETVVGKLVRCSDGSELWSAQAEGTWNRVDTSLSQMGANYVKDLGPDVEPYIAPTFHLLKPTLDTLPNPKLTDQEQVEKAEND